MQHPEKGGHFLDISKISRKPLTAKGSSLRTPPDIVTGPWVATPGDTGALRVFTIKPSYLGVLIISIHDEIEDKVLVLIRPSYLGVQVPEYMDLMR